MRWVGRAGELRRLIGKRDALSAALTLNEAARLAELERFFAAGVDPERAPFMQREQLRRPVAVAVTFLTGQDVDGAGEARDISAEGMYVACHTPLRVGSRTVVRVLDRSGRHELRFSAEVVRVDTGERPGMGLRFIGIPVELRVGHRGAPPELPHRRAA